MKRNLTLLFASALLVFSLAACNGEKAPAGTTDGTDNNGTTTTTTNRTTDGILNNGTARKNSALGNTTSNRVMNNTANGIKRATNGVERAVDRVENRVDNSMTNRTSQTNGISYDQMLRNGRVYDTDGFLKGGKTYVAPNTMY